ncbi:MAG: calcium/proton exchanger [Gemmataceae bacterium]|nr:calcium/proton exchanger [Gemmataceae bacterium]
MPSSTAETEPRAPGGWRDYLTPLNVMMAAVPAAAGLKLGGASDLWLFVGAGLAIVPLAGYMGKATEALAEKLGPTAGGLLNATFGNAAELIIALMLLWQGPHLFDTVKATLTGSIIGNVLLVLGLAVLVGGARWGKQTFDRTNAGVGATLLALAAAGLLVPTLFFYLYRPAPGQAEEAAVRLENLSEEIAVVLMVIYALSLLFTLRTAQRVPPAGGDPGRASGGRQPPASTSQQGADAPRSPGPHWGVWTALGVLLAATAGVAVMSEWLVHTVEAAGHQLGMNAVFVGVIVVAVIGNAAEHSTAVLMAWRNDMEVAVQIAVGSSIQVALFVAPVLVFASLLMDHPHPLDLHFTPLEVAAVVLSVAVIALVCHDGESNWLEGAMLLGLYLILALAFYNLPAGGH